MKWISFHLFQLCHSFHFDYFFSHSKTKEKKTHRQQMKIPPNPVSFIMEVKQKSQQTMYDAQTSFHSLCQTNNHWCVVIFLLICLESKHWIQRKRDCSCICNAFHKRPQLIRTYCHAFWHESKTNCQLCWCTHINTLQSNGEKKSHSLAISLNCLRFSVSIK